MADKRRTAADAGRFGYRELRIVWPAKASIRSRRAQCDTWPIVRDKTNLSPPRDVEGGMLEPAAVLHAAQ
jgi:hypothetical protein